MKHNKQQGFTLIEVLVASAIVMASMGLLMNLFGSGLERMNKIGRHAHQIIAEKEIIHRLGSINFAKQQQGKDVVEGYHFAWAAKQIEDFRLVSETLGEGAFPRYIALYRIDITIERDSATNLNWHIKRLGWQDTP